MRVRRISTGLIVVTACVPLAFGSRAAVAEVRDRDRTASSRTSVREVPPQVSGATVTCPSDPRRGVYHPRRLRVLAPCRWAIGTVVLLVHESDGDWHVDVALGSRYAALANAGNRSQPQSALVTEIVPGQRLPLPHLGERIAAFGTWVTDRNHGWNELHPLWAIRYFDRGQTVEALPPVPPLHP